MKEEVEPAPSPGDSGVYRAPGKTNGKVAFGELVRTRVTRVLRHNIAARSSLIQILGQQSETACAGVLP